jgi:glucose/mannose-6-phosphate isomerase
MSDMKDYLLGLEKQIKEALIIGKKLTMPRPNVAKVLFFGMGGSGISAEILRIFLLEKLNIPFDICRSPKIPAWVDEQTLMILTSYSGNTGESLSAAEQAIKAKAKMLVVTSGGKLAELAKAKGWPSLLIPGGLPPRCAIGYLTFSLIPVLQNWKWIGVSDEAVQETLSMIRNVPLKKAKAIALQIQNAQIFLYGCAGFSEPILIRWRAQLAENAKALASSHVLPEMFHNEIEAWGASRGAKSQVIFLFDQNIPSWLAPKMKAAKHLFQEAGAGVTELQAEGKSLLARIFYLLYVGDWVSYELALLKGIDPVSIPTIELIKKS